MTNVGAWNPPLWGIVSLCPVRRVQMPCCPLMGHCWPTHSSPSRRIRLISSKWLTTQDAYTWACPRSRSAGARCPRVPTRGGDRWSARREVSLKILPRLADTRSQRAPSPIPTLRETREGELSIFTETQVGSASHSSCASRMKGYGANPHSERSSSQNTHAARW